MPEIERFAIDREGQEYLRLAFIFRKIQDVFVGVEGRKAFFDIFSKKGHEFGRHFIKDCLDYDDGKRQEAIWHFFKSKGVQVPEVFKLIITESREPRLLLSDMTKNGRYFVLSMNNPEINTDGYRSISQDMSEQALNTVLFNLVYASEVASGLHNQDNNEPKFKLNPNAFMLSINPYDSDDALASVVDFGYDVNQVDNDFDEQTLLKMNLISAATFYAWMTGDIFQLPNDHQLASELNPSFRNDGEEILEHRGYT